MKTLNYDLAIVGGGVAGVSSALSASRLGLKVILIEKGSILGGLATSGLINWFEPLCDSRGHQILSSQVEELFNLSIKYGYKTYDDNWKELGLRKASWFDHNLFALSLNRLLKENNVDIYYETTFISSNVSNKNITSVRCFNVEGEFEIIAKTYIDASGNAALARSANLETRSGVNYLTYVTTTYKDGLNKPLMQYSGSGLDGKGHPKGLKTFNGLIQDDVNEYLSLSQEYCLKQYEKGIIKDIGSLPNMPQFRKIASIVGEYTLDTNDEHKHQYDSIGLIPVFNKPGQLYEIPLRCLYSNKISNLYFAGRIISSINEAWEATRVIPVSILTGEVTGIISYLKINNLFTYDNLKEILIKRDIKINF